MDELRHFLFLYRKSDWNNSDKFIADSSHRTFIFQKRTIQDEHGVEKMTPGDGEGNAEIESAIFEKPCTLVSCSLNLNS